MKSIYKSEQGRETMEGWYDHFLERLSRRGHTLDTRRVETRHGATQVLIGGPKDAPKLLCFHGAMATAPAGLAQIPQLLDHFRVYFPDTVGQPGRSDHRRLNWQGDAHGWWALDVVEALELSDYTAFGVSLGGYVVLRLASIAPERVPRAVIWAPAGLAKPPLGPMFGLIWKGLIYNFSPSRTRLERILAHTFTDFDDDYVGFFADSLKYVHPDRRFPKVLAPDALSDWHADVMLIVNEHDRVFPADRLLAQAQTALPGSVDTHWMMGCAHMPPFQDGALDEVVERIQAFATQNLSSHSPSFHSESKAAVG